MLQFALHLSQLFWACNFHKSFLGFYEICIEWINLNELLVVHGRAMSSNDQAANKRLLFVPT